MDIFLPKAKISAFLMFSLWFLSETLLIKFLHPVLGPKPLEQEERVVKRHSLGALAGGLGRGQNQGQPL